MVLRRQYTHPRSRPLALSSRWQSSRSARLAGEAETLYSRASARRLLRLFMPSPANRATIARPRQTISEPCGCSDYSAIAVVDRGPQAVTACDGLYHGMEMRSCGDPGELQQSLWRCERSSVSSCGCTPPSSILPAPLPLPMGMRCHSDATPPSLRSTAERNFSLEKGSWPALCGRRSQTRAMAVALSQPLS